MTLTEVKVQVTQNRMILRLRWWLMLNNMSSCHVLNAAVGEDFTGKDDLIGAKYSKLLRLEMVPERAVLTHETKKLYDDSTVHLPYSNLLYTADLPGITALIVPPQCHQGM